MFRERRNNVEDDLQPIIYNGNYCGYKGTIVKGIKTPHPRGYCYSLVVILNNGDIIFGSEHGNYAGGVTLCPDDKDYKIKKEKELNGIKEKDFKFYKLIMENI